MWINSDWTLREFLKNCHDSLCEVLNECDDPSERATLHPIASTALYNAYHAMSPVSSPLSIAPKAKSKVFLGTIGTTLVIPEESG